ncbi:uncharacterized protein LOC141685490 [Apium graveolens]|uniref:uncharacterized protein LOC141685490 n=1 Tax=Apium graveolens TaxID=4045 RepID=UPI003D79EF9C
MLEIETVRGNNQSEPDNESDGVYFSDDSEDPDHPDFKNMGDSEDSEEESLVPDDCVSDEEKQVIKRKKLRSKRSIGGVPRWEVGQKFVNMAEFRDQVRTYGVSERRVVRFITNDARRCQYLVEVFGDRIRKNPQWSCKEMAETIKNEVEIEVPRIKILGLRKAALEGVAENLKQHYSRVRDFGHEIGWNEGCRPVIGLDGCFLKTVTGGQLLAAVRRDGNNQIFPICYAVVESENTDSWRWFPSSLLKRIFWNIDWAAHKVKIHYKLMTRIRQKKDDMMKSDLQICPKIKKYLDILITESRKWSAAWDGHKKIQVKLGTRSVTVDLDARSSDCRMFDLTGIPCHHAIAAIHLRRYQPVDYVSEYYKREKYLATYQYSLEAMKGEEYWDFHAIEELLPPDIPKKLRGRPKKLRRREAWERGSRSQATPSQGVILQRFSNKRVMHCSNCRQEGHRVSKCSGKDEAKDTAGNNETIENEK